MLGNYNCDVADDVDDDVVDDVTLIG